ncbi:hypothetical protein BRD56_12280 [Thermoplasmatales archaeon SW_10_69_26]|nr:MAG: hypothetical protein BRD56_12280 [Thermoplasmatales archaeon SW_10_69_26]
MTDAPLRSEFPTLEQTTYLNSCSLCALSQRVRGAVRTHLEAWETRGASAWYDTWLGVLDDTRERFADLIGAGVDEVALLANVSTAMNAIASGLTYEDRSRVVTTELDFPTVARTWQDRPAADLEILDSPDGIRVPAETIEDALDDDTAALATSHVFYATGAVQDIQRLSEAAADAGALSIVDAYQGTGQLGTDVDEVGCDVLVTGGLKWLLGGTGIAYLYVDRDTQRQLSPDMAGWFGDERPFAFDTTTFRPRQDARRFEMGTPSLPSVHAGNAGLAIVDELGPATICERQTELTTDLVDRLHDRGFSIETPLDAEERAGIVMVDVEDPESVVQRLAKRDIIVDHRPGRVRVSPYFYNTIDEIEQIAQALDQVTDLDDEPPT